MDKELGAFYSEMSTVSVPKWQIEEEQRKAKYEKKRQKRFAEHRVSFKRDLKEIRRGELKHLFNPAQAYLGKFSDITAETPRERLVQWLGTEIAQGVCEGFIQSLNHADLPSVAQIVKSHTEGRVFFAEYVMFCGIAEMLAQGQDISTVNPDVLMAALVAWHQWPDLYERELGVDLGQSIADLLLVDEKASENFLKVLLSPKIESGNSHVSGLYRFARDERLKAITAKLALDWLENSPKMAFAVECELADLILDQSPYEEVARLVHQKLMKKKVKKQQRELWLSVGFFVCFDKVAAKISSIAKSNKKFLFDIRNRVPRDFKLSVAQCDFLIRQFSTRWKRTSHPEGGWSGNTNPWDATDYIINVITTLGNRPDKEATEALNLLVTDGSDTYRDFCLHNLAQQRRLLRDSFYTPLGIEHLVNVVDLKLPETVDDLKQYILDKLEQLEKRLRGSDVDSLSVFYTDKGRPRSENKCRDRLIDFLKGCIPDEFAIMPEIQMPLGKRVDIDIFHKGIGIPIEIKGQWHSELWNAPVTQLDGLYSRDWRADGRGIFLVLWFGNMPGSGKQLCKHPDSLPKPQTPKQLQELLEQTIPEDRKSFIGVVVLDLSKLVDTSKNGKNTGF